MKSRKNWVIIIILLTSFLFISAGCADSGDPGSSDTPVATGDPGTDSEDASIVIKSIALMFSDSNTNKTILEGQFTQVKAIGNFTDDSTTDITDKVVWLASDSDNTKIDANGNISGTNPSIQDIDIEEYNGINPDPIQLTISQKSVTSIIIIPDNPTVINGMQLQLTAVAHFDNGDEEDISGADTVWSSQDEGVVTIISDGPTEDRGKIIGISTNSAKITVTYGDVKLDKTVVVIPETLVSIDLKFSDSSTSKTILEGLTAQAKAIGNYDNDSTTDMTDLVTWTVSDSNNAKINSSGNIDDTLPSSQNIDIQDYNDINPDSIQLTISQKSVTSIDIAPKNPTVINGMQLQLAAIAHFDNGDAEDISGTDSVWISQNTNIVSVISDLPVVDRGKVTGVSVDPVTITATYGGMSQNATVVVTPVTLVSINLKFSDFSNSKTILEGLTAQAKAIANYNDGSTIDITNTVTWTVSDSNNAKINSSGNIYDTIPGSQDIDIQDYNSINPSSIQLTINEKSVTSIGITPENPTVINGMQLQLTAVAHFDNGDEEDISEADSVWSSQNTQIVTIISDLPAVDRGKVTGVSANSGTITATYGDMSQIATVVVTPVTLVSIDLEFSDSSNSKTIIEGQTAQAEAIGNYNNGSTADMTDTVTWTVSDSNNAKINSNAKIYDTLPGSQIIDIQDYNDLNPDSIQLTINEKSVTSIVITPENPTVINGMQIQLTAIAHFDNGDYENISGADSVWSSQSTNIVTVINDLPVVKRGKVTGVLADSGTITATYGDMSQIATVVVTPVTLVSINLKFSDFSNSKIILEGQTAQAKAIGSYNDGSTADITDTVTWTVSDSNNAKINGSGDIYDTLTGSQDIDIQNYNGINPSSILLTINEKSVTSIVITPENPTVIDGMQLQLTAIAHFDNGDYENISGAVSVWSSQSTNIVTVINDLPVVDRGKVTGVLADSGTITATYGDMSQIATVVVTPVTLVSINLKFSDFSNSKTIIEGQTAQAKAIGSYNDGSTADITDTVTWTVSDSNNAKINGSGDIYDTLTGSQDIDIQDYNGINPSSILLTINEKSVTSIVITPENLTVIDGMQLQLTAIAHFDNGDEEDISETDNIWNSQDEDVVTIISNEPSEKRGWITGKFAGTGTITAHYGNVTQNSAVTVVEIAPESVVITPLNQTIVIGTQIKLSAFAHLNNGEIKNVSTEDGVWSSQNEGIVTIISNGVLENRGTITGESAAETTITAYYDGKTGNTTINVIPVALESITLMFSDLSTEKTVLEGLTAQAKAIANYNDGSTIDITDTVTWTVSDSNNAKINSSGNIYDTLPSSQGIDIQNYNDINPSSIQLTINEKAVTSIVITPENPTVINGMQLQLTAIAHFDNGDEENISGADSVWSSQNTSVVSVVSDLPVVDRGKITGVAVNSGTITATYDGMSQNAIAVVTPVTLVSIDLKFSDFSNSKTIIEGQTAQAKAIGNYNDGSTADITDTVTWTVSDSNIAKINSNANIYDTLPGSQDIDIQNYNGINPSSILLTINDKSVTSIIITPENPTVINGMQLQLTAVAHFDNGDVENISGADSVWSSQNTNIVSVISDLPLVNRGKVTGLSADSGTVIATYGNMSQIATVVVTPVTLVSINLKFSDFSNSKTIIEGQTAQAKAIGNYNDGSTADITDTVTWTVSDSNYAKINSSGNIYDTLPSSQNIDIQDYNGINPGSLLLTINEKSVTSIVITPENPTVINGMQIQLTAVAHFDNGDAEDISGTDSVWSSQNTNIVSVISDLPVVDRGKVTGLSADSGTITATYGGKSQNTTVEVTAVTLESIDLMFSDSSTSKTIFEGLTAQAKAIGNYNNGSTADMTDTVTWTVSDANNAEINSSGNIYDTLPSSQDIDIQNYNDINPDSIQLTISQKSVISIVITPEDPTVIKGMQLQLTAIAHFDNGDAEDISGADAVWSSQHTNIISVISDGPAENRGKVTGLSVNSGTIVATYGVKSQNTTIQVTAVTLESVDLMFSDSSTSKTIFEGLTAQAKAIAIYNDESTIDITDTVTWTVSDSNNAKINSSGNIYDTLPSSQNIYIEEYNGKNPGPIQLTISQKSVTSIVISPENPTVINGMQLQLTAAAHFDNGDEEDISRADAVWSSQNTNIVTVISDGPAENRGKVTGVSANSGTITATYDGMSQNATVVVTPVTLISIDLEFSDSSTSKIILEGETAQAKAIGKYNNDSTADITDTVTWTVSDSNYAKIDSSGNIYDTLPNSQNIDIQDYNDINPDPIQLTISQKSFTSIVISPENPTVINGMQLQLTAVAHFDNGDEEDISGADAVWSSDNTNIVTVISYNRK